MTGQLIATVSAPAKVNAALIVGGARQSDGKHRVVTVMQSLDLADTVSVYWAAEGAERDLVVCPGVVGENLALRAATSFRELFAPDLPAVEVRIEKRIPLAGGMAGGSADAGAVLRVLAAQVGVELADRRLEELAGQLGADVPHQLQPGLAIATGAGEVVERVEGCLPGVVLVLPAGEELSTAKVFAEFDKAKLERSQSELDQWLSRLQVWREGPESAWRPDLMQNDLQQVAVGLSRAALRNLERLQSLISKPDDGVALVSGSGPTTLLWLKDHQTANAALDRLEANGVAAIMCKPISSQSAIQLHN